MNKNQILKIIDDYRKEETSLNIILHEYEVKIRAIKARQKFVKRKINILYEKIDKCSTDTINWSCDDFDDLDIL